MSEMALLVTVSVISFKIEKSSLAIPVLAVCFKNRNTSVSRYIWKDFY